MENVDSAESFLMGLELKVSMNLTQESQIARISQLTQKTNQFNLSTIRRTESEISSLLQKPGFKCWSVEVVDRFGDYGLVGGLITEEKGTTLHVDTFLLSCRVLGKKVEDAILAGLKTYAIENTLTEIEMDFYPSAKNAPFLEFMERTNWTVKDRNSAFTKYLAQSKNIAEHPAHIDFYFKRQYEKANETGYSNDIEKNMQGLQITVDNHEEVKNKVVSNWQVDMTNTEKLLHKNHLIPLTNYLGSKIVKLPFEDSAEDTTLERQQPSNKADAESVHTKITGKMSEEKQKELIGSEIMKIWKSILGAKKINLDSEYFEIGGNSVKSVQIVSKLDNLMAVNVNPTTLFQYTTIRKFVQFLFEKFKEQIESYCQSQIETEIPSEHIPEGSNNSVNPSIVSANYSDASKVQTNIQKSINEPIAIIGISGNMPDSDDLDDFWQKLKNKENLVKEIPKERWNWKHYDGDPERELLKTKIKWGSFIKDVDKFDADFFGISEEEADVMDPQQRLFLQNTWSAIEDAGYRPSDFSGTKTGVFVGAFGSDYMQKVFTQILFQDWNEYMLTGNDMSFITARISYMLNLRGPSEVCSSLCASSLIAIYRAVESIRTGESDMAIAGGVNIMLLPNIHIFSGKIGLLSPHGISRTFDDGASGFVRGESVGAVILKPLSKAQEDGDHIYAVIKGSAIGHGGYTAELASPYNPNAQADVICRAWEQSGIDPRTINYLEAASPSSHFGDPIEVSALRIALERLHNKWGVELAKEYCGISTTKNNTGNTEAAAGVTGFLKIILSMKNQAIPGTANLTKLNPLIDLEESPLYIVKETKKWEQLTDSQGNLIPRRAGITAYAKSGVIVHLAVEDYENDSVSENETRSNEPQIVVLSAKNDERLKEYANKMLDFLSKNERENKNIDLKRLAYTLQVGRTALNERLAFVVQSIGDLKDSLEKYCSNELKGNAFRGKIEDGLNNELMKDEEKLEKTLNTLISSKNSIELSKLWVMGADIEWNELYTGIKPNANSSSL